MIISLAQVQPKYGDVSYNLASQETFIRQAAALGSEMILFPELSITGYEPTLADKLATHVDDERFQVFQELADQLHITIITSAPLQSTEGITISLLIYQTGTSPQVYSKQYLHADEVSFFVPEKRDYTLESAPNIGLAICYELSVQEHFQHHWNQGRDIYMASTAKTASGSLEAHERLSGLAKTHGIITLFVNCVGSCDGVNCNGQSAAWNRHGNQIGELSSNTEGLLLIDTASQTMYQIMEI